MKATGHFVVGVVGTAIASIEPDKAAAIFAGVSTGAWMLYQLGAAMYDRAKKRQSTEPVE
jgi:hypothetical protein